MKKMMFLIVIIFALSLYCGDLEIGGYLENKSSALFSKQEIFSNIANLRIESYKDFSDKGGMEINLIVTGAKQPIDPFVNIKKNSLMESTINQVFDQYLSQMDTSFSSMLNNDELDDVIKYAPYSTFIPTDVLTLDRAMLKLYFSRFDLYLGRQIIAWGTGYAFNPTDIWNMKNPLDPDAPKSGADAFRLEIPFGSMSGLSLVLAPDIDLDHLSGGFRLKSHAGRFDFSICNMRIMNSDRELLGLKEKIVTGADAAGQIFEVGTWIEAAFTNPIYDKYSDFDSSYFQIAAGLDYTFTNGIYIMGEYYYNGLGQKNWKDYSGTDLINVFSGEMSGYGQNYVMAGIKQTFFELYDASLFSLLNATDVSFMILPSLDHVFSDNITVGISAQIGIGDKEKSEFGSVYNNMMLAVKGYF